MNEKIKQLAEQSFDITKDNRDRVEYSADSYGIEKFAELIIEECAACCGSQADKKNIRKRFNLPVESNIKYEAPPLHSSIKSQYSREYNIPK